MKRLLSTIKNLFKSKTQIEKDNNLKCPNCKNDQWVEGPGGGGSFGKYSVWEM